MSTAVSQLPVVFRMSEKNIQTTTVSRGVAKSNPIELLRTPHTIIEFEPTLHESGIKGQLIKYKKAQSEEWSTVRKKDFKSHPLGSMEKVVVDLSTDATRRLLEELTSLEQVVNQGIQSGHREYVVADKETAIIINDGNKFAILKRILEEGLSDEYWEMIARSQPDLADRLAAGHIHHAKALTVAELTKRLTETYPETAGPDSWQAWIYQN
jgi:hypothetical protein